MERDPSLFQASLGSIKATTWYRQRFDACPHFMFFLGDAHVSNINKTRYPFGQDIAYAGFSKNRADWYHSLSALEHTAAQIIEASAKDPLISERMIKDFAPLIQRFYETCETLRETDLSTQTDEELLDTYSHVARVYTDALNASPLIDGFALSTDTLVASRIKAHIETRGLSERFVEYFEILTAPPFLSFLQTEERDLLRLAQRIQEDPAQEIPLVQKHQRSYFWIRNNYVKDHIEPIEAFQERLKEYRHTDINARIAEIENLPTQHEATKRTLMDELELPDDIRTLLRITDDFNAWQDERKRATFWATHCFTLLLQEFSRRSGYPLEQLVYALPPEMDSVLRHAIDPAELERRIAYCMIVWEGDRYDITTDPTLIAELEQIGMGENAPATELKGFTASRGVATGTAKILTSAEDAHTIEEGDILVAVMTRPDYLPAMQRASAFVTDEGGITCHAAIVAREMKKPCIIGTKIATRSFKDGDMIEVNADQGIVRRITS